MVSCSFPGFCLQPVVFLGHRLPQQPSGVWEAQGKPRESPLCGCVLLSALRSPASSPPFLPLRIFFCCVILSTQGFQSYWVGGMVESTSHRGLTFALPWDVSGFELPHRSTTDRRPPQQKQAAHGSGAGGQGAAECVPGERTLLARRPSPLPGVRTRELLSLYSPCVIYSSPDYNCLQVFVAFRTF